MTATAGELAAFERARNQGTVAAVEAFLRDYPGSGLTRRMLVDQSPATLQGIDDGLVAELDPSIVNSLPFRVKQLLGILVPATVQEDRPGPSDGYSG